MSKKDTLTIISEADDVYVVRIARTDEKTGERKEDTDVIARELFKAMIRTGYMTRI